VDNTSVGFWLALIASIMGIVLAIVAIAFSLYVNNRSEASTRHTIRTIARIDRIVQRQSDDTRELIKVAWDRMLPPGTALEPPEPKGQSDRTDLAAGIATEMSERLSHSNGTAADPGRERQLAEVVAQLKQSLTAPAVDISDPSDRPSQIVDKLISILEPLSPISRELARTILFTGHVTRNQYDRMLSDEVLGDAMKDLRRTGLLVPLTSAKGGRLVYHMPPRIVLPLRVAFNLLHESPDALTHQLVHGALATVGYRTSTARTVPPGLRSTGSGDAH
jgi:hypothetical protein